jgi:hypothetical protein
MASIISAGTTSGTALNMAGDTSGVLQLATNGSTTAVTISTAQNVGIGTASPTYKLSVNSSNGINSYDGISGKGRFVLGDPLDATGYVGMYRSTASTIGTAGNDLTIGCFSAIAFTTGGTSFSTQTERMRIDSSGYVRVNNTTGIDGQFSSVAGSYYAGAFANTDAAYPVTYNWNRAASGNNLFMTFYTEVLAAARGTIDYNRAGNAVRYNTTSDQRLKENIIDAPSATSLINSIKIRSFDWKETGFHVDYGVIAQELNEVAPDAVSEGIDNEDGTIKQSWGVDTSVLVPALIKSIQEQQTIINDLKARITALEGAA